MDQLNQKLNDLALSILKVAERFYGANRTKLMITQTIKIDIVSGKVNASTYDDGTVVVFVEIGVFIFFPSENLMKMCFYFLFL